MNFNFFIFAITLAIVKGLVTNVENSNELLTALKSAAPGDVINLADGLYEDQFEASVSGTSSKRITLQGSRKAILTNKKGYGFYLTGNYWNIKGFSVANSKKGIMLDGACNNIFDGLFIHHMAEEGFHFRKASSNNVLKNSEITYTGLKSPGFGEAVYVGSAINHWENNKPDLSNGNKIINNTLGPYIGSEEIDIKEGTIGGLVEGNKFDGTGMSGENFADSWMDIKGTEWVIQKNVGKIALLDGFQVHHIKNSVDSSGTKNIIRDNVCSDIKGECVNLSEVEDMLNQSINNKKV